MIQKPEFQVSILLHFFILVKLHLGLVLLCSSQKHAENLGVQEMLVLITVACKKSSITHLQWLFSGEIEFSIAACSV